MASTMTSQRVHSTWLVALMRCGHKHHFTLDNRPCSVSCVLINEVLVNCEIDSLFRSFDETIHLIHPNHFPFGPPVLNSFIASAFVMDYNVFVLGQNKRTTLLDLNAAAGTTTSRSIRYRFRTGACSNHGLFIDVETYVAVTHFG